MDKEALYAAVHGSQRVRQTWLSNWTELNWTDMYQKMATKYVDQKLLDTQGKLEKCHWNRGFQYNSFRT